jgi:hypothetical protein
MDDKFTYDVSEEEDQEAEEVDDDGGPSEITAIFLSAVEGISNARKYFMRLHGENRMMAALSSIEKDYTLFSRK